MGLAVVKAAPAAERERAARTRAGPEARPIAPGHGSPLNYYVPGVCVTGVCVTLPTTGTGREPGGTRALPG